MFVVHASFLRVFSISPSAFLFTVVVVVGEVGVVGFGLVANFDTYLLCRLIFLSMPSLHKAELRTAGRYDTFRFQTAPRVPLHRLGDGFVDGLHSVRPQDTGCVVPHLTATPDIAPVPEAIRDCILYEVSAVFYEPPDVRTHRRPTLQSQRG